MRDLEGRTAVVTGAASGIGRAMAERFARAGMKLALVDLDRAHLEAAAEELRTHDTEVLTCVVDVAEGEQMDALAEAVIDRFGAVHLVCNNAGVASAGPVWELTTADWDFVIRPNLWGVIHGIRVFGKHLIAQDEGHIVNTASMAGLVSVAGLGPYNATKHAVVAISETLHGDLAATGSKVGASVLCPGFVRSRIWDSDRYRPDQVQNPGSSVSHDQREAGRKAVQQLIESSMPAERVAEKVLEAVTDNCFYILTHESTGPAFAERAQRILKGEDPAQPEGGPVSFAR